MATVWPRYSSVFLAIPPAKVVILVSLVHLDCRCSTFGSVGLFLLRKANEPIRRMRKKMDTGQITELSARRNYSDYSGFWTSASSHQTTRMVPRRFVALPQAQQCLFCARSHRSSFQRNRVETLPGLAWEKSFAWAVKQAQQRA